MIQIGLEIPYTPAFAPTGSPQILQNLSYELVSLLFNLSALFSQLAAAEDRGTSQGLKQAIVHTQVRFILRLLTATLRFDRLECRRHTQIPDS